MRRIPRLSPLVCVGATLLWFGPTSVAFAQDASISQQTDGGGRAESVDLEVLMRGPVHEGFAEPSVDTQGEARGTLRLPEPPPEPIDERPAAARPISEDRQATWLPGYWGVEEEDQLCWVSGTWRYSPPGLRWVPGYWAEVDGGATWVPGFWIDRSQQEITYLPPPPQRRETRRPERPGDDYFWVPGHHRWRDGQYVWRDGFWAEVQPSWVWVPARYVATPRGHVFVSGYWDYPPDRRGTLFAPVRFARARSGYQYRPNVAVNIAQALVHWFVRPNYGHYYFGNYYGNRYRDFGLRPWAPYADARDYRYYDPLHTYYSVTQNDFLNSLVRTRREFASQGGLEMPIRYRDYRQFASRENVPAAVSALAGSVDALLDPEGDAGNRIEQFADLENWVDRAGDQGVNQIRDNIDAFRRFARGRRENEIDFQATEEGPRGEGRARDDRDGDRGERDPVEGERDRRELDDRERGDRERDREDRDREGDDRQRNDEDRELEQRRGERDRAVPDRDRPEAERGRLRSREEAALRGRGRLDIRPYRNSRVAGEGGVGGRGRIETRQQGARSERETSAEAGARIRSELERSINVPERLRNPNFSPGRQPGGERGRPLNRGRQGGRQSSPGNRGGLGDIIRGAGDGG